MHEKILVIDDEKVILDLTAMVLREKGYEVLLAESASVGYAVIEQFEPAVVLLDYMMPEIDGMTALREIRRRYPQTYVIMFTGKGNEEIAVELMKAGAVDYIPKPFSNTNLIERIEHVLRLREIELRNLELLEERERLREEIQKWNLELERRVEEKTTELEKANAEILQTEKLAALGHLSAGMAHEIRNPLNSINLFAQILCSGMQDDPEMASYADKIAQEVERIDDILVKLLATSKRSPFQLRTIRLQDVIDDVLQRFADQATSQRVVVQKTFVSEPPPILADYDELSQVFSNLISNALFEMSSGGELQVVLSHENGQASVQVRDTGGGIPREDMKKIFDPFFTTKKRGTGFGLSVVLRIMKTYGGRIDVESSPDVGTRFTLSFPLE